MPEESNCFLDFMLQSQTHKKLQYAKATVTYTIKKVITKEKNNTKMASEGEVCPIPAETKEVDIYRDTPLR